MDDDLAPHEKTPLLNGSVTAEGDEGNADGHFHAVVYQRRWWILCVFCLCSLTQSSLWNTFSPLLDTMLIAYDWSDSFIAIQPAVSNAGFVIMAFPLMYIIETKDLRLGMIIAASLLGFGSAAWNIALSTQQDWLVIIGSILNGIPACVTMAAPPLLSVLWFPASERTTATALSAMSGYMGTGMAFITGPYISGARITADDVKNRANLTQDFVSTLRDGVHNVIYFESALAVLSLALIFIYFPPKPPKPPSKSQTVERENFWKGLKHLSTNVQFWIMNIAYNLPNGAFNSWVPLLSVNFRPLGMGEETAGWIGFASMIVGCLGSVGMSMVVDHFKRKMKLFLVTFSSASVVIYIVLVLIQLQLIYVPVSYATPLLYVLCMLAAFTYNGVIPVYYEFGCESAYPVHEGLSCTFITVINNIVGMAFFLLFQIPQLADNTQWMSCTVLGVSILSIPLLLLLKDRFYRLDMETTDSDDESTSGSINA